MRKIFIPGYGDLKLEHIVFDYNGTLACGGHIIPGVKEKLTALSGMFQIHILTADTFGKAADACRDIPCTLSILNLKNQAQEKLAYIRELDTEVTACVGNGRNDNLMLREAALGICVILGEGAAAETMTSADVVCTSIDSAMELFLDPLRLVATLRS